MLYEVITGKSSLMKNLIGLYQPMAGDILRITSYNVCYTKLLRNRVGLCTGQVVAGAVGSHGRMTYTVHGNAVNMAARLETMNKQFGTRVLMSAYTAQQCRGVALRRLADAEVRGYERTIELYTPAEPAVETALSAAR